MYHNPLVSIIIPVYNGDKYLAQAINSALNQTYKNIEIIIINDGSTDHTEKIALSYGDKINYYKKENGGVATALNLGIEKMQGEYFSWLSHDDLYCPYKIEKQVKEIFKHTKNTIIYTNYGVFDNNMNYYTINLSPQGKSFRYWLIVDGKMNGCTLLIPKSAFVEYGLFNPSLKTTQDYDMWFRMSSTYKFFHLPEITVFSRSHDEQGTVSLVDTVLKENDDLYSNFISQLQPSDVIGSNKDINYGYIQIANSCLDRLCMNAYNLAMTNVKQPYKSLVRYNIYVSKFKNIIRSLLNKNKWLKFKLKNILTKVNNVKNRNLSKDELNKKAKLKTPTKAPELLNFLTNLQDKFTSVYEDNLFEGGESRSGEGSNLVQTEVIRNKIPWIIKEYNIESFLDAPCGDWYWMQHVDLSGLKQYIGIDIVKPLIDKNNKLFVNNIISFKVMNITESELPKVDLILCRDCLVHLSYNDAIKIIKNFKRSGSKYLLITTFINRSKNYDIDNLFWRTLNMQKPPFNFPKPILLINENCTEDNGNFSETRLGTWILENNGNFSDKCLGLWLLEDIKI